MPGPDFVPARDDALDPGSTVVLAPSESVEQAARALLLPVRLEARRLPRHLAVRIYPDRIHLGDAADQTALSDEEHAFAERFWSATDGDVAWSELAAALGPRRALHTVLATRPDGGLPLDHPHLALLPRRWSVRIEDASGEVTAVTSARVTAQDTGLPDDQDSDHWLTDLDEAIRVGMAVRVPLTLGMRQGLRRITVVGFGGRARDVAERLESQSVARRVAVIGSGTPTNHGLEDRSAWSPTPDADDLLPAVQVARGAAPHPRLADLGAVLGRVPAITTEHPDADDTRAHRAVVRTLLVPGLKSIAGDALSSEDSAWLTRWAGSWVRPEGHWSPLQIGDLVYGIHPVSTVAERSPRRKALRGLVDRLATAWPEPEPDEPLRALARTPHPHSFGWQEWAARTDLDGLIGRLDRATSALERRDPERSAAIRKKTFTVVLRQASIARRAVTRGMGGSFAASATLDDHVDENPQAEVQALDARARTLISRGRGRMRNVPSAWERHSGWHDRIAALRKGARDAKYRGNRTEEAAAERATLADVNTLEGMADQRAQWEGWRLAKSQAEAVTALLPIFALAVLGPSESLGHRDPREIDPGRIHKLLRDLGHTGWGGWMRDADAIGRPRYVAGTEALQATLDLEDADPWLVRAAASGATTRLDAWITGFAAQQWSAQSGPVVLGAWGVLDGFDEEGEVSTGHLLAPSAAHAATAAVLRSGRDDDEALDLTLTGARTRDALALLDAIRAGQDAGTWLGRRLEQALHDASQDRRLTSLRRRVMGSAETPLDGLDVYERREDLPAHPAIHHLLDTLDASRDLLLAEATHQLLAGRAGHAARLLQVLEDDEVDPPMELDVLGNRATPRRRERAVLASAAVPEHPPDRPRARAAPALDAWCTRWLGAEALERPLVVMDGEVEHRTSAHALGLCALDLAVEAASDALLRRIGRALDLASPRWGAGMEWRVLAVDLGRVLATLRPVTPPDAERVRALAAERLDTDVPEDWDPRPDAGSDSSLATLRRKLAAATDAAGISKLAEALFGGTFPLAGATTLPVAPGTTLPDLTAVRHVRPRLGALVDLTWSADALGTAGPDIHGSTDLTVLGPTGDVVGWEIDRWSDPVPEAETRLGLAIRHDAPSAQAPNVWLAAVVPQVTDDALHSIVESVLDQATLRRTEARAVHKRFYYAPSALQETR